MAEVMDEITRGPMTDTTGSSAGEGVAQDDRAHRQALGARGADEVAVHHLYKAAAHDAADGGHVDEDQQQHGQDHEARRKIVPAPGWHHLEPDGEYQDQHGADHERVYYFLYIKKY